ncbi:MAG: prepilin peptidase [Gammaproteobacteria bacterium]|nr:prepilin peptidase [Gammaproteobacteria bacterium]
MAHPVVLYFFAFLLGLIVGSFLNVVIFRLPMMMENTWREQCDELSGRDSTEEPKEHFNLIVPRSRCRECGKLIKAWQNIPIISYLILKGRCSSCGSKISLQYPLVELIAGALSCWVVVHFGLSYSTLAALFLTWALIALSVIDLKHTLLPDDITLPFLWLGLILSMTGMTVEPTEAIVGATAGYLILWSVYWLFKLITGKEGMGYGDFKLLAMLGAWMGWQALPAIILLSSVVGTLVGISLVVFVGHDRRIPIPFGPYLAAAGWIYLLYGKMITGAYLQWLSY